MVFSLISLLSFQLTPVQSGRVFDGPPLLWQQARHLIPTVKDFVWAVGGGDYWAGKSDSSCNEPHHIQLTNPLSPLNNNPLHTANQLPWCSLAAQHRSCLCWKPRTSYRTGATLQPSCGPNLFVPSMLWRSHYFKEFTTTRSLPSCSLIFIINSAPKLTSKICINNILIEVIPGFLQLKLITNQSLYVIML